MSGASLSLSEYRALARSLPQPTPVEMQEFAMYVARAHSWYKHLDPWPPGSPLVFFLDPNAGMQLLTTLDGSVDIAERAVQGFHYSWIPTKEYRRRFGFLAYARAAGTRVHLATPGVGQLVPSDDSAMIYDPNRQALIAVPSEIVQAGTARINALIQYSVFHESLLLKFYARFEMTSQQDIVERVRALCATDCASVPEELWPAESGGTSALTAILRRICALREQPSLRETLSAKEAVARDEHELMNVDKQLYDLIVPERRRQLAGLVQAIARMLDLVHGPAKNAG